MSERLEKAPICKKHNRQMYFHPEEGYGCNECQTEMWTLEAESNIVGLKCPVCGSDTELKGYDENYVDFGCKSIFDKEGNFAKPPCPQFRIVLCDECARSPCQCQEYPEQPEREHHE